MEIDDAHLNELISRLTLPRKVQLLTGRDFWSTWPLEEIGLRSMTLSDGPAGVRGPRWDERSPSLNLPSGTALAASWDPEVAHDYGRASASEARRKGVDVVLGPTMNLHRSPLGGRHFEALSEDPVLTATMAAAYVDGVQSSGVGASPKHYIANDFETERFTADVRVSERALRELYLLAFEGAVTRTHPWMVMSSYNSINGATATENELLETPLNSEWGFDGVVVSDWTAVRSIESARHAQDLAMPGPEGAWGDALVSAVERGEVSEAMIDRKVLRLLRLAARVGAIEGTEPARAEAVDGPAIARRAEVAGMVLVENGGILPVEGSPPRIAVIGHNASAARTQGGGSATVLPASIVTPLAGIRAAFPDSRVDHAIGAIVQEGIADIPLDHLINPATGSPGVRMRYLDGAGVEVLAEDRFATSYVWLGRDAPRRTASVEATTIWTPSETAPVRLGFAAAGHATVIVNGTVLLDETVVAASNDLGAALFAPPSRSAPVNVTAGVPVEIVVRYRPLWESQELAGTMAFAFGIEAEADSETLLAEAEALASSVDLVVLVVGTNSRVESEGYDRIDLRLPGKQDDLARRVLAANPRTVVVVNAGSPVELPWADSAAAILLTWFGGQELGAALGDVLTGLAEPGGRLPTTWPVVLADVPVVNVTPENGALHYSEGIHIGYRAWLRADRTPRWWFGAGFGYTRFEVGAPQATPTVECDGVIAVTVPVTNTGRRAGKHVVQVYAARNDSHIDRPVRWLVGAAAVVLEAGESVDARLDIPARALAHWSAEGWEYEPGTFEMLVAAHAGAAGRSVKVELLPSADRNLE